MSLTFTFSPQNTYEEMIFLPISLTNGRQAIAFEPCAALQQQFRYHHPGTVGQYLVRDGQTGRNIAAIVRYMGSSLVDAETSYKVDYDILNEVQISIIALGQVYFGCNLVPGSLSRLTPVKPTGRTAGQVYFDVTMAFTQDNPGDL